VRVGTARVVVGANVVTAKAAEATAGAATGAGAGAPTATGVAVVALATGVGVAVVLAGVLTGVVVAGVVVARVVVDVVGGDGFRIKAAGSFSAVTASTRTGSCFSISLIFSTFGCTTQAGSVLETRSRFRILQ